MGGFGCGAMLIEFPHAFWDQSVDYFGYISEERGRWAQWYDMESVTGKPILIGFNAGSVAGQLEASSDDEIVAEAMTVLRTIYR